MDMDPDTIKGVWGFNGTERPGAVYLGVRACNACAEGTSRVRNLRTRRTGRGCNGSIPDDVREKLLRFGRAAVAVATMRGRSYLQIGSICMGIGGSIIDPAISSRITSECALSPSTRSRSSAA